MADISRENPALDAALRLLSYRPRAEAELRRRLLRRFPPEEVESAIQALRSQGYLDDREFARFWRDNRERFRPRSARVIRGELLRLGVGSETASEALEGFDDEENAVRAARKRLPSLQGADYQTFEEKLGPYLLRRGFPHSLVQRVVRRLWEESADPLDGDVEGHTHKDEAEDATEEGAQRGEPL